MTTPFVEDWRAAMELRAFLLEGGGLTPLDGPSLAPSEPIYAALPGSLDRLEGVPLAFATSDPSTHALARQWRTIRSGKWYLTGTRLALMGESGPPVLSLGWRGIERLGADDRGLLASYASDSFRVNVHCPQWLLCAVNWLGYHRVVQVNPPDWVVRELGSE